MSGRVLCVFLMIVSVLVVFLCSLYLHYRLLLVLWFCARLYFCTVNTYHRPCEPVTHKHSMNSMWVDLLKIPHKLRIPLKLVKSHKFCF